MMTESCFFTREQIHLLIEEKINIKKSNQVQAHIADCKKCTSKLGNMRSARHFLLDLSTAHIDSSYIRRLNSANLPIRNLLYKWRWANWPASLRWSVEYIFVASFMFLTIHYFPWKRVVRKINTYRKLPQQIQIPIQETIAVDLPLPTPVVELGIGPTPPPVVGVAPVKPFQPKAAVRAKARPTPLPMPVPNYNDASDDIGTEIKTEGIEENNSEESEPMAHPNEGPTSEVAPEEASHSDAPTTEGGTEANP